MTAANQLETLLQLRTTPVAVTFRSTPPANVPRGAAAAPSGCSFWKRAADGQSFYTEASDHYNCPIGAYTHGIDLPPAQAKELEGILRKMFDLGYLRPEEISDIPRRQDAFGIAVYAPLADATFEPDVVLVRGNAKQVMLLTEATQAAGVGTESGVMGRPTCAAIPQAIRTQRGVASFGCIGNRVYAALGDDELYFVLPGKHLGAVVEKLATIVNANHELEHYHRARVSQS